LVDVKLDQDENPRAEVNMPDFELCREVQRLLDQLKQIENGEIERIEIRAGIPRRLVFQPNYRCTADCRNVRHPLNRDRKNRNRKTLR
jgi:hypothetical protein